MAQLIKEINLGSSLINSSLYNRFNNCSVNFLGIILESSYSNNINSIIDINIVAYH